MKKGTDPAHFKTRRMAIREAIVRDLTHGIDGRELCQRTCERVFEVLRELWSALEKSEDAELAVVGSYGRGTPGPHSDLDLRIVVRGGRGDTLADALLYPLWDGGFSVGHQVVDPKELERLGARDLATATSILDLHHVAGTRHAIASPKLSIDALREDSAARQERFGGSVYLLEPEVKLGTGGLRDIDAIRWVLRATGRVLSDHDASSLSSAEELLLRIRNRLHVLAGRRSDRLSFDAQEALAIAMGYGTEDVAESAERLMQDYYRAARAVSKIRERILAPEVKRSREVPLGRGLVRISDHVAIAEGALEDDPSAALRVYEASLRFEMPVWNESKDAITRACIDAKFCERLRASQEAARTFVDLVCVVREVPWLERGSIVHALHDVGLLVAMIPEFVPVTGRVHHDVYHVLTVDAHSVAAVDCLRAMVRGELASEHPIATHLAAEVEHPVPLFLATLLHDFGKGYPDASGSRKNHSLRGAELCDEALPRLGIGPDDARRIRALVLHHLAMYHVAVRRDLDDPAAIEELVKLAPSRDALRDLYLLTIADISTTSPNAMTSWKARMLEHLFLKADAHFSGKSDEVQDLLARIVSKARPEEEDVVRRFVSGMNERYLAAHPPESILQHARIALSRRGVCAVELVPARHPGTLELCVVAYDAPGLLAKIAAALTANRLEVLAAHVHSLERAGSPTALDVFFLRPLKEGAPDALVRDARRDLEHMLEGKVDPTALLAERTGGSPWRERPNPAVPTRIVIDVESSKESTIVEVVTKDRPGLLFALAEALHHLGLSIVFAKVSTEGAKAIDVFYVVDSGGKKIESGERLSLIRDTLQLALSTGRTP